MTDPRVDTYIAKAQPFARPILHRLRAVVHRACPDVLETMKWSHPHFDYRGIFCGMAAFKAHCKFGFWKHRLLVDRGIFNAAGGAMGSFGRITSTDQLPSDAKLGAIVKAAATLNDQGVRVERPRVPPKPALRPPAYFTAAVHQNKKALAAFAAFSPSHRREYVTWVTEAKSDDTRRRRLETAVAWMAEGKSRNWKYEVRR